MTRRYAKNSPEQIALAKGLIEVRPFDMSTNKALDVIAAYTAVGKPTLWRMVTQGDQWPDIEPDPDVIWPAEQEAAA